MREYCPKCSKVQNLDESESIQKDKSENGEAVKIVTKSYHCQVCKTFIRSEDTEIKTEK